MRHHGLVPEDLVSRWTTDRGKELTDEVTARLLAGRSIHDLGLGVHDDRVDLRGFVAPAPKRLKRYEQLGFFVEELGDVLKFKNVLMADLDLSGASLPSFRVHDSQVRNCRLVDANCSDWRLWGSAVEGCDFAGASLNRAAVGTWHESRANSWRGNSFVRADCRFGVAWAAFFEDCDFSRSCLDGVEFDQCAFSRCRFSGRLSKVHFNGNAVGDRPAPPELDQVDFRDATFHEVEFRGFTLQSILLPTESDLIVVPHARCVARHGIEQLTDRDEPEARMVKAVLGVWLRGPGTEEDATLFNPKDWTKSSAEFSTLMLGVIRRGMQSCDNPTVDS